ncbi:MAG TPA: zinc ribbon domain-containing protein [Thermoplasmata archaeon]|nr:zinc ribbon domain-containing protein [Thermoplasmata archaeon]
MKQESAAETLVPHSLGETTWYGDLIVDGAAPNPANRTFAIKPGTLFKLFGNLTIRNGGRMWVNDSILKLYQSQAPCCQYDITVTGAGSSLSFLRSNLSVGDLILPSYWLDVNVTAGAVLDAKWSSFLFPGRIEVQSSTLRFNDSATMRAPNAFQNGTPSEKFGPTLFFNNSQIVSSGSSFGDYPKVTPGLRVGMPAEFGAGNTGVGPLSNLSTVDGKTVAVPPGAQLVLEGFDIPLMDPVLSAVLKVTYRVEKRTADSGTDWYNGTDSVWFNKQGGPAKTSIKPLRQDTTFTTASYDLFAMGKDTASELANLRLNFTHNGGNWSVVVDAVRLEAVARSNQEISLWGSSTWVAMDSHLDIDFKTFASGDHNFLNISHTSQFYGFGVTFDVPESPPLGPAVMTNGAETNAFLYRWASITATDSFAAPIPKAGLVFGSDFGFPLNQTVRGLNDLNASRPYSAPLLEHISRTYRPVTAANISTTTEAGWAIVPLISDIINHTKLPNSLFVGVYNASVDHAIGKASGYPVTLENYPKTSNSDNWHFATFKHPNSLAHADLAPLLMLPDEATILTPVNLTVNLTNNGTADAKGVDVVLFDDIDSNGNVSGSSELIRWWPGLTVAKKSHTLLVTTHTFIQLPQENHRLIAKADPNRTVLNEPQALRMDNTQRHSLMLRDLPDLLPLDLRVRNDENIATDRFVNGSRAKVDFSVQNLGDSPAGPSTVCLYDEDPGTGNLPNKNSTNCLEIGAVPSGGSTSASLLYDFKRDGKFPLCVWLDVKAAVRELVDTNNRGCQGVESINVSDLKVAVTRIGGVPVPTGTVTVTGRVSNVGFWAMKDVNVTLEENVSGQIVVHNWTLLDHISPNKVEEVTLDWHVPRQATNGTHHLWLVVNGQGKASPKEVTTSNNAAPANVTIEPMLALVNIKWTELTYQPGAIVLFIGSITADRSNAPLSNVTVTVKWEGTTTQLTDDTDAEGDFDVRLDAPTGPGRRFFSITTSPVPSVGYRNSIIVAGPGGPDPFLIALVAIAAIAGLAVAAFFMLARKKAANLAECSECGSFVAFDAMKCPKCGTAFEMEQVKCSSCLSWIPGTASQCPICAVVFTKKGGGKDSPEDARLGEEYYEVVEKKKEEFRKVAGKTYSEPRFMAWWKRQKEYVSLEDYRAERKAGKRTGAEIKCQSCETMNLAGTAVCKNCGTPLVEAPTPNVLEETDAASESVAKAETEAPRPAARESKEKRRIVKAPDGQAQEVSRPQGPTKDKTLGPKPPAPPPPSASPKAVPVDIPPVEVPRLCFQCFAKNRMDAMTCESCGADLPPLKKCNTCGEMVPQDMTFCFKCGSPM